MRQDAQPKHKGRRERRRAGPWVAALLAVGLVTAACSKSSGGPGVAGAGEGAPTTPSASPSAWRMADALAYSQCMRDHGISDFPDPNDEGGFGISAESEPGSALDPDNPRFNDAQEACEPLLPAPPAEEEEPTEAERLRYAQCMREHGFPDFPDPQASGFDIDLEEHPELSPDNPRVQEANEACGGDPLETPDQPAAVDTNT